MDDAFQDKLKSKLKEFQSWFRDRRFTDCRLVQYCGVDLTGTKSVSVLDCELEIRNLLCEGFYVDWAEHQGRLFLRVWEFSGPEPAWNKVFAEEPLVDVDEILRRATGED